MEFLGKIIFFFIGMNIVLAKRRFYNYEPHKTYHVPWAWKHPQPVFSVDGAWPFGSGLYQYQPQPEEYPYFEEPYYNHEILMHCLNKALTKINKLLPTNTQETTTHPSVNKPEVLAIALNHAIDKLEIYLSQHMVENVDITTTENPKPTTIISESVSKAVEDLNKLFVSLPEELKNEERLVIANKNKPDLMEPSPFVSPILSPELKPNPLLVTTTPSHLFTSHIVERNKEENSISETSKPFLSAENVGNVITTEINTEAVDNTTDLSVIDVESTTIKNDSAEVPDIDVRFGNEESDFIFPDQFEQLSQNKNPPRKDLEVNTRFESVANKTQIILEYKPSRPPFHPDIFPPHPTTKPIVNDDSNSGLIDRNKPTATNLNNPTTVQPQPSVILGFKPSRPPFHPDIFPPHPTTKPIVNDDSNSGLIDRNKPTATNLNNPTTVQPQPSVILGFKPSRPPFHPDIFPPHPTTKPIVNDDSNLGLIDRNKPTATNLNNPTTVQPQPSVILGFIPSRPPFHPDIFPPNPTPRPNEAAAQSIFPDIGDRNKVPETSTNTNQYHPTHYYSTPISLEYKPTRPFYAPNPIIYPKPMIPPGTPWPASSTEKTAN